MIFTDRTVIVQKGTSSINDTIVLYRGDREVEIRFTLNESSPFKFGSGVTPNIIEKTEAAYGQLVIKTPGDKTPIFSEITATKKGAITFTITAEMIDEITEVGNYTFQIRLLDENKEGRVTIPEVVNGIEVREPIATEDISNTNEVGIAAVGYALTTAGATEDAFDTQGNYNKTTWGTGDRITATKLNKIEAGIDGVNKKVASGGIGGTVDLSGYVTKETGNASQITFADGQTFQAKLDAGTLRGEKGEQGIQGPKGDSGADNIDDTTASKTTTYSSNKIEIIKEDLVSQIRAIDGSYVSIEKFQLVVDILKKATFVEDVSAQFNRLDELLNGQEVTTYTITNNLTNVTNSNLSTSARGNSSYTGTLNADSNYTISSVTITMGGTDITNSAYSNGTINISSITGNVIITAIATENAQPSGVTQSGSTLTITNATVSQTEGTLIIS